MQKFLLKFVERVGDIQTRRTYWIDKNSGKRIYRPIRINRDLTFQCLETQITYDSFLTYAKTFNGSATNARIGQQLAIDSCSGGVISFQTYLAKMTANENCIDKSECNNKRGGSAVDNNIGGPNTIAYMDENTGDHNYSNKDSVLTNNGPNNKEGRPTSADGGENNSNYASLADSGHSRKDGTLAVSEQNSNNGTLAGSEQNSNNGTLAGSEQNSNNGTLAVSEQNSNNGTLAVSGHDNKGYTLTNTDFETALTKCSGWNIYNTSSHRYIFLYKAKEVIVADTVKLSIERQVKFDTLEKMLSVYIDCTEIAECPFTYPKSVSDIHDIVRRVGWLRQCNGLEASTYASLLTKKQWTDKVYNTHGETVAHIRNNKIYSADCALTIHGKHSQKKCDKCRKLNLYLLMAQTRGNKKDESSSQGTAGNSAGSLPPNARIQIKRYKRLVQKLKRQLAAKADAESKDKVIRTILRNITKGVTKLYDALNVTACAWQDCAFNEGSHDLLLQHVQQHFIHQQLQLAESSLPTNKRYQCQWASCSRKFKSIQSAKRHLYSVHCATAKEARLLYLLNDQGKAILRESTTSMKWHPEMFDFCLFNYHGSDKYEQLRNSGFLKLPHGSSVRAYKSEKLGGQSASRASGQWAVRKKMRVQ